MRCSTRHRNGRVPSTAGSDLIDPDNGGFQSAPEADGARSAWLYDTEKPGNGNGGHSGAPTFPATDKEDLLAYLKTL